VPSRPPSRAARPWRAAAPIPAKALGRKGMCLRRLSGEDSASAPDSMAVSNRSAPRSWAMILRTERTCSVIPGVRIGICRIETQGRIDALHHAHRVGKVLARVLCRRLPRASTRNTPKRAAGGNRGMQLAQALLVVHPVQRAFACGDIAHIDDAVTRDRHARDVAADCREKPSKCHRRTRSGHLRPCETEGRSR
jgi:hypothetical protein